MGQDRAEVELTIQIGAETDEDLLTILTQARSRARSMMMAQQDGKPLHEKERVHEEQWCSGAMRVTLHRPHFQDETQAVPPQPSHSGEGK